MKRLITICALLTVCSLQVPPALANPIGGGSGGDSVSWNYWSPLSVVETIADLGGGLYRYSYSLVNVDTSPIWHFGIYTPFVTQGGTGGTDFSGHASWGGPDWIPNIDMFSQYVGTNLDPAILGITNTFTTPWEDSPTAIQIGEATSGYSFVASTYDPSLKYYFYETIASGYTQTNATGRVAAVGQVVPVPGAVLLGILGLSVAGIKLRKHA